MKQKLLNSFTWRGTLLVALLSCAFSAWGQTATLEISDNSTSVTANDITWKISGNYDSNTKAWKSPSSFKVTSSIKGKITKIEVYAKSENKNNRGTISVSVGGSQFGSNQSPSNSWTTCPFKSSALVDGANEIEVTGANSSNNKVVFIKKITVTYESAPQFTISPDCHGYYEETHSAIKYFGTYSYEYPFKVPAAGNNDLKVSTISVSGGVLTLNALREGTIVPANTGVLVSAFSPSSENTTYNATPTLASGNAISGNLLKGSIEMPSTTPNGTKYYCLSMKNGNIGFYYGGENGGRFDMPANRAFLAVSGGGIKGFSFSDMVDGIKAVETAETEDKAIYNLAGQRVSKMQKGIYVVNGKKVLVK